MQKLSLIPLVLITTIGVVFAMTQLPDTPEFPRTPQTAGTIGGALYDLFNTDGSAKNTEKLNGITASGYLQNKDCNMGPINQVWVGVDATGKAICGTRTTLLADIGTITEKGGSFTIWRGGTAISSPVGTIVREGDTIITDASGTGTIAFIADESILRLDTSTTVELSIGQLSGQPVAQAILSDGRLWGRILTSTGVNLGGGGMVAGVRGTSVSVARTPATQNYTISIIDSTKTGTDAATVSSTNPGTNPISVSSGTLLTYTSGSTTIPTPVPTTKTQFLTTVADALWIRANTLTDIDHLVVLSGSDLALDTHDRVRSEIAATLPPLTDMIALDSLCAGADIYWPSLIDTDQPKCRDHSLIAFADYTPSTNAAGANTPTTSAAPLYLLGTKIAAQGNGTSSSDGYKIGTTGQYISYDLSEQQRYSLSNKTITIELGGAVGSNLLPDWTKAYIADFGSEKWFVVRAGQSCNGTVTSDMLCRKVGDNSTQLPLPTTNTISIRLSTYPTKIVIGNLLNANGFYDKPIGTIIKNIYIQ